MKKFKMNLDKHILSFNKGEDKKIKNKNNEDSIEGFKKYKSRIL